VRNYLFILVAVFLGMAFILVGCWPLSDWHEAQKPSFPDENPPLTDAVITVPIRIPFSELHNRIEPLLPKNIETNFKKGAHTQVGKGQDDTDDNGSFGYLYDFHRTPVQFSPIAGGFVMTFNFDSFFKLWKRKAAIIRPLLSGETNRFGGSMTAIVRPGINQDWSMQPILEIPDPHVDKVEFHINLPIVSLAKADITGKVKGFLRDKLNSTKDNINSNIAAQVNLPAKAHDMWSKLAAPIKVLPNQQMSGLTSFLAIHPISFSFGGVTSSADAIELNFQLKCRPEFVTGFTPPVSNDPLPPLSPIIPGGRFYIQIPVVVDLLAMSAAFKARLLANGGVISPPNGSQSIKVTDAEVFATGAHLVVRVDLAGSVNARVYLLGTPHIDSVSGRIMIPDLKWTAESKSLLGTIAIWLLSDHFDDLIRGHATFDGAPYLAKVRFLISNQLNLDDPDKTITTTFDGQAIDISGLFVDGYTNRVSFYFRTSGECRIALKHLP